ncbi:MAG: argininosuccinate synthase [Phycisphaerales bacterium]|jgi:argininosuccinate synthase
MAKKIVLAYSGGLDTTAIVPWLKDQDPDCEVHAFVADVGQGAQELEGVEEKAIASGASSCVVADLKDAVVAEYAFPTLAAGALYEGRYLLGTSLARPIIAQAQAEHALAIGADALSHGCTGKGNDQVRFETGFAAVAPHLQVIAPWREWDFTGREPLIEYVKSKGISTTATAEKIYSRDANIWHISHEGGALEDPWNAPPEDVWTWTVSPENAPNTPEEVSVTYENATPVAVNGVPMSPVKLLETVNDLAAAHGVGRVDLVENRVVGIKSRGCYETPGGTLLFEGLKSLDELCLDRASRTLKEQLGLQFAQFVYDGRWFSPARASLSAALDSINAPVSGEVVIKLYKGTATTIKRKSPTSLYRQDVASFEEDGGYNQKHAEGFIRLFSLPIRLQAIGQHSTVQMA